jgi:hypothetical protein
MLKILRIDKQIEFTGKELASHWIYRNFNLTGDAAVAFIGPAHVPVENMVDLDDVKEQAHIYSPLMLNFIIEHFSTDLELAVYRQRLFITCIKEELELFEVPVARVGDNLYINRAKLSVSVATCSMISSLIHVGLNIATEGTPVKAAGLQELGIKDISSFAQNVLRRYQNELEQIYLARCKVRGVL